MKKAKDVDEYIANAPKEFQGKLKELLSNFSLSQPTLSHHFNKLIDVNILKERKE